MCNKGNFKMNTRIKREPVEVSEERHASSQPRGLGDNSSKIILRVRGRSELQKSSLLLTRAFARGMVAGRDRCLRMRAMSRI